MISQTENAATIAANTDFARLVTEYKALLAANGLPFSVDVELLKTTLRTQLFQKLLAADKGLKMRFDMLKSNEARMKLVSDTIDLTGYDIVDEAASAVTGLEKAYKRVYTRGAGFIKDYATFAQFADVCGLDLAVLLDSYTYDWAGKEHVLAYFQTLGQKLAELRNLFRAGVSTHITLGDACQMLAKFYTRESAEGEVFADEGAVMLLATDLVKAGKLDLIPV